MLKNSHPAGFVLAGGQSLRMGRDKALLEFRGKPLLLRTVELLRPYVDRITVLGSQSRYSHFGLRVLADEYPAQGPLGGICMGLKNSLADWNIFLACDLPLLDGRILDALIRITSLTDAQAVVPKTRDGWQPLCAAYQRSCVPAMEQAIERGNLALVNLLRSLRVEVLTANHLFDSADWEEMFWNVNTTEDWEGVQRNWRT